MPEYDQITVTYNHFATEPEVVPVVGTVVFTLENVNHNDVLNTPTGCVTVRPVTGHLDGAGRLCREDGTIGVVLTGNDADFALGVMTYRAVFTLTTLIGTALLRRPILFNVAVGDTAVNLNQWAPVTGAKTVGLIRGERAFPIAGGHFNGSGALVLENSDGSQLTPITPVSGTLVVVDNGDGTVSIG